MPLARIITSFAEDAQELIEELHARGFEVRTVAPGENPAEPADLEITLEECAAEDALIRASQGADEGEVAVFISPGTLAERAVPTAVVSRPSTRLTTASPTASVVTLAEQAAEEAQPKVEDAADGEAFSVVRVPVTSPEAKEAAVVMSARNDARRKRDGFWDLATMAAVIALTALLLISTARRWSPTSFASTKPEATSPVPFHKAEPPKAAPTAIVHQSETAKPAAVATLPAKPHRSMYDDEGDVVAKDTVVRYGSKPATPRVQAKKKSDGIKRYSDANGVKHYDDLN